MLLCYSLSFVNVILFLQLYAILFNLVKFGIQLLAFARALP